ncbi:HAD-IIB family hydrolase [Sulfurimonas lithotrophica]|uniref:HAD-IIB family hydrolase n=1 Tax=Sulfurimonas lithotrophica TaxID=2590022 RepID=A0A5P8P0B4_9BACT|nr:HAD family hydrolase [Sulfurimonas lithotrophica]QFR49155.1 HAD-IIB family hydrolase [Sulfurimonas lithotrophica]
MGKVFITDLDHTFLRSDLSVSEFTKDTWNSLSLKSTLSVATARTFKKTEQFLDGLNINAPMILLDGSLIVSEDKKIIDMKIIEKDMADAIIELGSKHNLFPFVLALKDKNLNEAFLYPKERNDYQHRLLDRYIGDDNLEEKSNIRAMKDNFKLVYMGDEDELLILKNELYKTFGNSLKYILAPEAYMDCYFLTLLHADADKAHGLKKVNEYLNIDFKHYTVFGDNLNDIGMFELAGTSVAVANAHKDVKKIATYISKHSNDEDAVAKYLRGFIS